MTVPTTERVAAFIAAHGLDAEIISTPAGCPTVEAAALALGVDVQQIIKTLVFVNPDKQLVIGIACGTGRVDRKKLSTIAGIGKLQFAPVELVIERTGFPPGGVAPIALPADATIILDTNVVAQSTVYGGSGTDIHMLRIHPADILRLNNARIADILHASS